MSAHPHPRSKTEARPRMTVEETAAYGGWTTRQVRRWAGEGRLPYTKPGRALEFTRDDVEDYIAACRRPATRGPLASAVDAAEEDWSGLSVT